MSAGNSLTYDDAGNMRLQYTNADDAWRYTYDAWNRLVKAEFVADVGEPTETATTRGTYAYNGLNWRVLKYADTDADGAQDQARFMYYSPGWQLVEEFIMNDQASAPTSPINTGTGDLHADVDQTMHYVWGIRYIDDIVARFVDDDLATAGYERVYYHLTDAQFSTVAIIDDAAKVKERVDYTPYGVAMHRHRADFTGERLINVDEQLGVLGNWGVGIKPGDLDRTGEVDIDDLTEVLALNPTAAEPVGVLSASDPDDTSKAIDNQVGYCGYIFNAECGQYHVRHRTYSPELGRWLQRDPLGYVDGLNLYVAFGDSPQVNQDPSGLHDEPGYARRPGVGYGGKPNLKNPKPKQYPRDKHKWCMDECTSGCPWVLDPDWEPSCPEDTWHHQIRDRGCVMRCERLCSLGSPTVPGKGTVRWDDVYTVRGTTRYEMNISVIGEDPNCCSEVAIVQFVRYKLGAAPWTGWQIDDGRVGAGSPDSPSPPYYYDPVPIEKKNPNAPGGASGYWRYYDEPSGKWFSQPLFEFIIVVFCSQGPAAGHIYGTYSWSVGATGGSGKCWSSPIGVPGGAGPRELPPLLQ